MANNFYAIYPPIEGGVASNPSVGPNGLPAPVDSTEIGFIDGSGNLQGVSAAQPLPVTVISGPNPTNVNLADVAGVATPVGAGASNAGTQRVILSSDSPLAPGAATAANQTTEISSLSTIATNTTGVSTAANQVTGNSSLASILANQTNGTQETQITGTVPLPTGAATAANQTTQITELTTINTTLGSPIQQTGGSVSVTNFPATQPVSGTVAVSNFPATQPISAVSLPLPTGAATNAELITINTTLGTPLQAGGTIAVSNFPSTTPPAAPFSGQQTSTGTAVAIAASQALAVGVIIQAKSTNTSSVYVGPSGVTTSTGFELQPGQATSTAVNNLNAVYVISITSGDGICYIGS